MIDFETNFQMCKVIVPSDYRKRKAILGEFITAAVKQKTSYFFRSLFAFTSEGNG